MGPILDRCLGLRGSGVHLFGELLREFFGDGMVVLEDHFAQAEGHRLFLDHRSFFTSVA